MAKTLRHRKAAPAVTDATKSDAKKNVGSPGLMIGLPCLVLIGLVLNYLRQTHTEDSQSEFVVLSEHAKNINPEGFEYLLHPLSVDKWKTQHWERAPLHIKRVDTKHYDALNSGVNTLDEMLMLQQRESIKPLLLHPETKLTQADCIIVKDGMNKREGFESIYHAYLNGGSLVCNLVPAYWPPLAKFMTSLSDATGYLFLANMYLSPRYSQGFSDHTDNKDGFIIQISGAKHWSIFNSTFIKPMRSQMLGRAHERNVNNFKGSVVLNTTITKGDLLFVPRGFIHHARAGTNQASLHYTISAAKNLEWCDCLSRFLPLFQGLDVSIQVKKFTQSVLTQAVGVECGNRGSGWIRGALPFFYKQKVATSQAEVMLAYKAIITKLKTDMSIKLAPQLDAQPAGRIAFEETFRELLENPNIKGLLDRAIQEDDVYFSYVESLLQNGRQVNKSAEISITSTTVVKLVPKVISVGKIDTSTGVFMNIILNPQSKLRVRFTKELESAVQWVLEQASASFEVQKIPGNDLFEKVCLVRELLRLSAVTIV
eukprot:m.161361 g.161361  ORF g.161361 m.161361 type:complete len:540 (+) comp15187_c0_seq5:187-1806(+)